MPIVCAQNINHHPLKAPHKLISSNSGKVFRYKMALRKTHGGVNMMLHRILHLTLPI